MKKTLSTLIFSTCFFAVSLAQADTTKLPELDKSPMDMCYFPVDYPVLKISEKTTAPPVARIIYGRPQKNGRPVFGGIIEYGKVWRLGANEATEIEFYKDVTINSKKIKKGRYTLYAIPNNSSWILIINKDTDTWGAFKYEVKNDVLRVAIPVKPIDKMVETLSMTFSKNNSGFDLIIAWENTEVMLPILSK